jgi:hypothetical protein
MGLWTRRPDPRDVLIAQLRAELSDLRSQQKSEREQWLEERKALLDKVLALANPLALREVRRTPGGSPVPALTRSQAHYPGEQPLRYPPYPPSQLETPPVPPEEGN